MKKIIFLSLTIILFVRSSANTPERFKIVIPAQWKIGVEQGGYLDIADFSSSDTLQNEIIIFSPDGMRLASVYSYNLPDLKYFQEAIVVSYRAWESLKKCKSYTAWLQGKRL
jgi:hypothetical protein